MKLIKSLLLSAVMTSTVVTGNVFAEQQNANKPVAVQQKPAAMDTVNINTADAATLADKLNGIGLKKAQAIVSYREQNGAFKSADDLVNVPGIGPATLEKNKALISI
ncbi:MAG: ComEA family DNA-binding protein [Pseudomonadales bacterium]